MFKCRLQITDMNKRCFKFDIKIYILEEQMFENGDSSKWTVAPFSNFYAIFEMAFVLTLEKRFFLEVSF